MKRFLLSVIIAASVLVPTVFTHTAGATNIPRFQINCGTSHVALDDPIVNPGAAAAHAHEFFGNTTTNRDSTEATMAGQTTTCSTFKDTAAYWTPKVKKNSNGNVLRAQSVLIYYRGEDGYTIEPFPAGLKMISDDVTVPAPLNAYSFTVRFPSCWNGTDLDSTDHRSHMAFKAGNGSCPTGYPVHLPEITEVFRYPAAVNGTLDGYHLTSDEAAGWPTGVTDFQTAHADFWNTWDQDRLTELTADCLNAPVVQCERIDEVAP